MLWDADFERERLVRACSWKNLRVTFASYEEGGAFWKQTVYSPRDSKTKLIPVKATATPSFSEATPRRRSPIS